MKMLSPVTSENEPSELSIIASSQPPDWLSIFAKICEVVSDLIAGSARCGDFAWSPRSRFRGPFWYTRPVKLNLSGDNDQRRDLQCADSGRSPDAAVTIKADIAIPNFVFAASLHRGLHHSAWLNGFATGLPWRN